MASRFGSGEPPGSPTMAMYLSFSTLHLACSLESLVGRIHPNFTEPVQGFCKVLSGVPLALVKLTSTPRTEAISSKRFSGGRSQFPSGYLRQSAPFQF